VSDRALRFPDRTWDELEALPQPLRNAAHRAIFHLLEERAPELAEPFPDSDPLPGAYLLYLLSSVGRVDHLVHGHGKPGHRQPCREREWMCNWFRTRQFPIACCFRACRIVTRARPSADAGA
jgi:hypothetical protein